MGKFVARSGREVKPQDDGSIRFGLGIGYLGKHEAMDAEEYFQAKRDADLERWRDPVSPDHVVYPLAGDRIRVFREHAGTFEEFGREDALLPSSWHPRAVAYRYFEAHPERRPWDDANEGDIWVLTGAGGLEQPWRRANGAWRSIGTNRERIYDAVAARDGHRIWPEDAS